MDYWHLLHWALKPANAPLPANRHTVMTWARVIDNKVKNENREPPHKLRRLLDDPFSLYDKPNPRRAIRIAYKNRLIETPGVVATSEVELDTRLVLRKWPIEFPEVARAALETLSKDWRRPDDVEVMDGSEYWSIARTINCGFYLRWLEPGPKDWMKARRIWSAYCRRRLTYNRSGLDSPKQVEREAETLQLREWIKWRDIRESFTPVTEICWLSDFMLEEAGGWLDQNRGIAWVENIGFGTELANRSGVPYFGAGDDRILTYRDSCVASIGAHGTGKNLQQYNRMLFTCPSPRGLVWEQALGRMHRQGQQEDHVIADVFLPAWPATQAIQGALNNSDYHKDSLGQSRRLLYCEKKGMDELWSEEN